MRASGRAYKHASVRASVLGRACALAVALCVEKAGQRVEPSGRPASRKHCSIIVAQLLCKAQDIVPCMQTMSSANLPTARRGTCAHYSRTLLAHARMYACTNARTHLHPKTFGECFSSMVLPAESAVAACRKTCLRTETATTSHARLMQRTPLGPWAPVRTRGRAAVDG